VFQSSRREALAALAAGITITAVPGVARAAGKVDKIGIDYAYYNPVSLVLKQKGWLEQALEKNGTHVEWVLSLGSNKANEFLAANVVQFGSTAGSAAFLARANGSPIRTVFLYSQPEWTALVVGKNSPITSVAQLRGKKVAATRGTDPWFFLLRSLRDNGMTQRDIELVDLQHPDGRVALERGQVDAWSGLDPHMAASQLDAGSRLLYRNIKYNTYGALNSREDFLRDHPDLVATVLQQYQRARLYSMKNIADAATILSGAANVSIPVANIEVKERTKFPDPTPGRDYHDALSAVVGIVRDEHLSVPGADLDGALAAIVDPQPAKFALARG
jgi:sulfonate transport system substrate-binding protein